MAMGFLCKLAIACSSGIYELFDGFPNILSIILLKTEIRLKRWLLTGSLLFWRSFTFLKAFSSSSDLPDFSEIIASIAAQLTTLSILAHTYVQLFAHV